MKYKNTKTGVTIDVTSEISGGDWVRFDEPDSLEVDEYVEEEVDLEEMTNRELEEFAKENDIELTSDDKKNKDARIAAIVAAFE